MLNDIERWVGEHSARFIYELQHMGFMDWSAETWFILIIGGFGALYVFGMVLGAALVAFQSLKEAVVPKLRSRREYDDSDGQS
jgi:ABC-type branched-subunit amino acid transport system permease subunit